MKTQSYKVTYTKAIGTNGTLIIKARNEKEALSNAKNTCKTGSDFRNVVLCA